MNIHKKALAVVLTIVMLFTMIPATVFSSGAQEIYPVMEKFTAASSTEFHAYYSSIYSATFLDKIDWDDINAAEQYWDSSADNDNSVIAYIKQNAEQTEIAGAKRYDLYIAGDGGVDANPDSGFIFYFFSALEEVRGCENFKTDDVTSMYGMFYECKKLRSITGINWDTSNVTDMSYMFRNCHELTELDLSSFNTSKVTTMKYMFYYCRKLEHIYVGDGWTTESIANLSDGVFNCCYAIMGGKDVYDEDFRYFPPGAEYAKLKDEGGFLTYKEPELPKEYKVTYEFTGNIIPDGVIVPVESTYTEGNEVYVEAVPLADGYIFSGWSTEDATVTDGKFTINNDVHFTGLWTKLYKVEYKYTEGFDVPEGAAELPEAEYFKPGDFVDVIGVPYVYRYLFMGWTTDDADVSGDMFIMPENDVVLYGYFKIPVESIEIIDGDITINKDEETRLNIYVKPEDATIKDIVYSSDNETVAKVDKYGNVTAVSEGSTTITVASKDDPTKSDTITVTVKIPVNKITVEKTTINLKKDQTDRIKVTVNPENATNSELVFESSDESVVKVDNDGNVEAVGEGEAVITVTSKDNPNLKEKITVTVKNPVTEITVPEKEITLYLDETKNVEADVNDDATDKTLIYESENPGIVKVDNEGNVVAVGEGTTMVKITSADNPTITETVTVTVVAREYKVAYKFIGAVIPDGASAPTEKVYKEGTEVIVEADSAAEGYIFSGWSTEDATVTNGKFTINNDVVFVGRWEKAKVPVENITVNKTEIELEPGKTDKITVIITPEDATDKTVTYSSSNPEVAEVTEDGTVIAKKDGETTVTVKAEDGSEKAVKIKVTVKTPVKYYDVTYKYEGEVPENAPVPPEKNTYKEGTEVIVETDSVAEGYIFSGWSTEDATVTNGKFTINNDVVFVGSWEKVPGPVTEIIAPESVTIIMGKEKPLGAYVNENAVNKDLIYTSADENVAKIDENGNIIAVSEGETIITVTSAENPEISVQVTVIVTLKPSVGTKHYIVFGKTEKIGWYSVSVDGGKTFFTQFGNDHLEVEKGTELIIKANDVFGDPFTFYINGEAVKPDKDGYVRVVVDRFMLIGALGIPVTAPDVEESLNLIQQLIKLIKELFAMIASLFNSAKTK